MSYWHYWGKGRAALFLVPSIPWAQWGRFCKWANRRRKGSTHFSMTKAVCKVRLTSHRLLHFNFDHRCDKQVTVAKTAPSSGELEVQWSQISRPNKVRDFGFLSKESDTVNFSYSIHGHEVCRRALLWRSAERSAGGQWVESEGTDSGEDSWNKGGRGGPGNSESL